MSGSRGEAGPAEDSHLQYSGLCISVLIRLGLPSGGEAGSARDNHLQYSGLCRRALFRSVSGGEAVSKSANHHLQYYELCKTVLFSLSQEEKQAQGGTIIYNILDSAEVYCLSQK